MLLVFCDCGLSPDCVLVREVTEEGVDGLDLSCFVMVDGDSDLRDLAICACRAFILLRRGSSNSVSWINLDEELGAQEEVMEARMEVAYEPGG